MARVFVDTNALFPFSVMGLMVALTEDAVHEVLWTDELLSEWARVIVREHRRKAASAAAICAAIREFFADRYHMAAAIAGGAVATVTRNSGQLGVCRRDEVRGSASEPLDQVRRRSADRRREVREISWFRCQRNYRVTRGE